MRECEVHTLKNGIRVVHSRAANTKIIHCGIMLDIGSRDESEQNQGIAHFWEHMAFKGTKKRNSFHILNRLETLGGELNAFTDKEKILFFASLRKEYLERAIELLTDITFNSVFPEGQIDRERHVILEEMSMYYDDPEDSLQDEFDSVVFSGHALGMNILGTETTVGGFNRKDFKDFIRTNLDTRRIVFSCVGDIGFDEAIRLAEKHMGHLPKLTSARKRRTFSGYKQKEVTLFRDVKQARIAIGRTAYGSGDGKRLPFYMLMNILGGPGMNSRLNLALREKRGLVYSIAAQYVTFTDTGLFVISFGTEPSQMKKSVALVDLELKRLQDEPLGARQLASAKEQIIGQLAMAEENNIGFMISMARNILDIGRVRLSEEIFAEIRDIRPRDLTMLANEIFTPDKLSLLMMEPLNENGAA